MATRWTTPMIKATITSVDVTTCTVQLTLYQYLNRMKSRSRRVDVYDESLTKGLVGSDTVVLCKLTQEQSGSFDPFKPVYVIANYIDSNGTRGATETGQLVFHDNPVDEVLPDGTGDIGALVDYEVDLVVADMIGTTTVGNGAITTQKLADGAVTTIKLADGAVTPEKMSGGVIVADGSITTAKLASGAVTEGKIASGAVTSGKLGSGAVTTAKIGDSQVTTAKVADGAVTTAKVADGAITADKVGTGVMTDARTTVLSLSDIDALFA